MSTAPFELDLAPGFSEGPIVSQADRWALSGTALAVPDLSLSKRRIFLTSRSDWNCPMAFDAKDRILYVGGPAITAFPIDASTSRVVAEPPEVPIGNQAQHDAVVREFKTVPAFVGLLELSPDRRELISLAQYPDGQAHVVRVAAQSGEMLRLRLEGWPAGISVHYPLRRICQPGHPNGARVLDLLGKTVAALPHVRAPFHSSRFSPSGAQIALSGSVIASTRGVLLWDLATMRTTVVDQDGADPAWSPDGTKLWYMKGEHELWCYDFKKKQAGMLVGVRDLAWNEGREWNSSYITPPVLSSFGRYLYFQLTCRGGTKYFNGRHAACVVDLDERRIVQIPGEYHHNVAWLD